MFNKKEKIHSKFQSIRELADKLEKSPRSFGTDVDFSHSEIHLIEVIGNADGLSVTDIGRIIGITKGAVSQTLKRLEEKECVSKHVHPDNQSRYMVSLTAKGNIAYEEHKKWHETMDGGYSKFINNLTTEKVDVIVEFMEKVEDFLKRRIKSKE